MRVGSGWVVMSLALVLAVLASGTGRAAQEGEDGDKVPSPVVNPQDALAANLRTLLLQFLPDPLYEDTRHWGAQKDVRGLKWSGQGLKVHPEVVEKSKNHGLWWKVRFSTDRPADTLRLEVRAATHPAPDRMVFTALAGLDARVEYERQRWEDGVRLFSGSVRARLRLRLKLKCEATSRIETDGKLLPEAVFRLRIVGSEVGYDNLVVEHVAGVGGSAARLLGDAVHGGMHRWHPSLERRLLDKADAALLKAGDTKEIRLDLAGMFGQK